MPEESNFPSRNRRRYSIFISHSSKDRAWAIWFKKELEAFVIPKSSREGNKRIIDRSGRFIKVFRDQENMSPGASLNQRIRDALDRSEWLLVILSPHSKQSDWVKKEIDYFLEKKDENRVICVIVNRSSGDTSRSLLPEGLVLEDQPLAIDASQGPDGRETALTGIVAAMLYSEPQIIGEQLERMRIESRMRRWRMIATGAFAALLGLVTVTAQIQILRNRAETSLDAALGIAEQQVAHIGTQAGRYGVPRNFVVPVLESLDSGFAKLFDAGLSSQGMQRQQTRIDLAFADSFQVLGDGAAHRRKAEEALNRAQRLVKDDAETATHQVTLSDAYAEMGEVEATRGRGADADKRFAQAVNVAKRLYDSDQTSRPAKQLLATRLTDHGDLYVVRGQFPQADTIYQRALELRLQLTRTARSNDETVKAENDLADSHDRLGLLNLEAGDLGEAESHFKAALDISQNLCRKDPENREWQRKLYVSTLRMGDLERTRFRFDVALGFLTDALELIDTLTRVDPRNVLWKRDLAVAYERIGLAHLAASNPTEAEKAHRQALAIRTVLRDGDTENTVYVTDVASSQRELARVYLERRDLDDTRLTEAENYYALMLKTWRELVDEDGENNLWRRELGLAHGRLGELLIRRRDFPSAIDAFRAALVHAEILREVDPDNTQWADDFAYYNLSVAALLRVLEQTDNAFAFYERAMEVRQDLISTYPRNLSYRIKLVRLLMNYATALARYSGRVKDESFLRRALGNLENAEAFARTGLDLMAEDTPPLTCTPLHEVYLAIAADRAVTLYDLGRTQDALDVVEGALLWAGAAEIGLCERKRIQANLETLRGQKDDLLAEAGAASARDAEVQQ